MYFVSIVFRKMGKFFSSLLMTGNGFSELFGPNYECWWTFYLPMSSVGMYFPINLDLLSCCVSCILLNVEQCKIYVPARILVMDCAKALNYYLHSWVRYRVPEMDFFNLTEMMYDDTVHCMCTWILLQLHSNQQLKFCGNAMCQMAAITLDSSSYLLEQEMKLKILPKCRRASDGKI